MICCTCGINIPPEFKSAIASNKCPGCEGTIMSESMKEFLEELKTALNAMPADPEGLAGWLLSHYDMRKVGTGQPVAQFYGKQNTKQSKQQIKNNPLQQYLKITGSKAGKTENDYNAIMEKINNGDIETDYNDDNQIDYNSNSINEADDPEYTNAMLAAMQDPSALIAKAKSGKPILSQENQAIINSLVSPTKNKMDLAYSDLPPALTADRFARLQKQQDLEITGSVGKIKRKG
jgi:effector-binding domain-containing protein